MFDLFKKSNWNAWSHKDPRGWRWNAYYKLESRRCEQMHTNVELTWGLKKRFRIYGVKLHLGNRDSDNAMNIMLSIGVFAIFWSIYTPSLKRFAVWIGRNRKRDLSLTIHDGTLWWKLWYDDDGGYDRHHECDSWRKPRLWPWSMGRKKHRGWMCLRDGNIALNPLDAFWGPRLFEHIDMEKKTKILKMKQFVGDQYDVELTLQKVYRGRKDGPKWARRRKFDHWTVDWDCRAGIPYRNDSWKGDHVHASKIRINSPTNWWIKAMVELFKKIEQERVEYRFRPPEPMPVVEYNPAKDGITDGPKIFPDANKPSLKHLIKLAEDDGTGGVEWTEAGIMNSEEVSLEMNDSLGDPSERDFNS